MGQRSSSRQAPPRVTTAASGSAVSPRRWMRSSRPWPIAGARAAITAEAFPGVADTPAARRSAGPGDRRAPPDQQGDTVVSRTAAAEALPELANLEGPALGLEQSLAARRADNLYTPGYQSRRLGNVHNARKPPNLQSTHRTTSCTGPPSKAGRVIHRVIASSAQLRLNRRTMICRHNRSQFNQR